MQIINYVMAGFVLLAILDRITGNRFGLGKELEKGVMLFGTLALSMIGMIVMAPLIAHLCAPALQGIARVLPFDPSFAAGVLIANDMGGANLAQELALTADSAAFNGLVVGSMMGATVSFTVPFVLSVSDRTHHSKILFGLMCGICVIPLGALPAGMILGLSLSELAINLIPLLLFSVLLTVGLWKIPQLCVKIFRAFGIGITVVICIGLGAGIFELLTEIRLLPHIASITEGRDVVFGIVAVLAGAFPMIAVLSRLLRHPLGWLGKRIGINEASALGFLSTLATSVTTFGNLKEMDEKGIVLNSAFAVSAAFTFADHMAFTMSFQKEALPAVIVGKLLAGVLGVVLAQLLWKKESAIAK